MENSPKDSILEFQQAIHLKKEAAIDNIPVHFTRVEGAMWYRVGKAWYKSFDGALNHVKSLQGQIAPSTEVRS